MDGRPFSAFFFFVSAGLLLFRGIILSDDPHVIDAEVIAVAEFLAV